MRTSIWSHSPIPSKRARNADSSAGIGALAKRSKPSGSAPQRRCTKPNSQFSPRLSNCSINRSSGGASTLGGSAWRQRTSRSNATAIARSSGGAAGLARPRRAGMAKGDREPLMMLDRLPGHRAFNPGDLADKEVSDLEVVDRDHQPLDRQLLPPD